jgi:Flp pilus assembly protein TadG
MRGVSGVGRSLSRTRDEHGATAVIVALVLVVLFAMIVLTIDVGGLLLRRRGMVNAADAAALAAAKSCADSADTATPEFQADVFAMDNVAGLTAGQGGVTDLVNCDNGAGYVTVEYTTPQGLIFAPVLGFSSTSPVPAEATAAWGPLAGGRTVPIVVESGTLQGPCQIPTDPGDPAPTGTCPLYYNNGDVNLGNADWGFMNLDQWNVASDFSGCSNAGSSDRRDWILNDYQDELLLNGQPPGALPTYVCVDTGAGGNVNGSSTWGSVLDRIAVNDVLLFPVNDCTDQRDKPGNTTGCSAGTPDKYSIVGFVTLRVLNVYNGNDPAAIGTPGTSGSCGNNGTSFSPYDSNGDILTGQQINLNSFGSFNSQCGFSAFPDSIDANSVDINPQGNVPDFVKCPSGVITGCDYSYDPGSRTVTWRGPSTNPGNSQQAERDDLVIKFSWSNAGTAGACGTRPSDPNAKCVITEWIGFTTGTGPVCDESSSVCDDYGTFGFVLCDRNLATCPDQG